MVSELKAKLSAYLSAVRKGEAVVVCDRRNVYCATDSVHA